MSEEEKFNQIYEQLVNQNADEMEFARGRAKVENRYNILILLIIVIINILLNFGIYKLLNTFYSEIALIFITISISIFSIIKHRGGKSKIEQYVNEYKEKIIGKMIKAFNQGLEFTPGERITSRNIR